MFDWLLGKTSDEEVKELDAEMSKPSTATSPLDESLKSFSRMLVAYGFENVPIQSKNIGNETAEKGMPSDLYVMIATAMNKIGRPLIFIPYDTQYIINEASTGGKINRIYPTAVIGGGITGYDKDLIEKEREGEVEGSYMNAQASARYNAATGVSRISLDLNMTDYRTQSGLSGVLATNSINLRKDDFGWGVSAYYMGCGGSFDSLVKQKQGLHHACRILVDFSILELLGRYFEVPYWKCIPGANPDTELMANLNDKFRALPDSEQISILKRYLFLAGFDGLDPSSPTLSSAEQNIFRKAMTKYNASNHQNLFMNVWENISVVEAIERAKELKRKRDAEARLAEAQKKLAREEDNKKTLSEYASTLENADKLFAGGQFEEAKKEYRKAANLAPNEKTPLAKIAEIDAKIAEEEKMVDSKFKNLVAEADSLLNSGNKNAALKIYEDALKIKPNDKRCADIISEIKRLAARRTADLENAKKMIADGDSLFKSGKYLKAKEEYSKALKIMPDNQSLKDKIGEINKLLDKKAPLGFGKIKEEDF